MEVVCKTNVGLFRTENQDRVKAEILPDGAALAVLCDGMGGGNSGSEASELAIKTVFSRIKNSFFERSDSMDNNNIRNVLLSSVSAANALVFSKSENNPNKSGMGTTCVVSLVKSGVAYVVNIGDSRAYCLKGQFFSQITSDHSVVQFLIEQGKLDKKDALLHPQRHIITKAVGVEINLEPDYFELDLYSCSDSYGSRIANDSRSCILLCSDGLSNYCAEDVMKNALNKMPISQAADVLMAHALNNGGRDNISLAIISE